MLHSKGRKKRLWALLKFSSQRSVCSVYHKDGSYSNVQDLGEMEGTQTCKQRKEWVDGMGGSWGHSQPVTDHSGGNTETIGKRQVNKLETELHMELILFTVMIYMDDIFLFA